MNWKIGDKIYKCDWETIQEATIGGMKVTMHEDGKLDVVFYKLNDEYDYDDNKNIIFRKSNFDFNQTHTNDNIWFVNKNDAINNLIGQIKRRKAEAIQEFDYDIDVLKSLLDK